MTMGTAVFTRIVTDHRVAAIQAIADTMQETVRFGVFSRSYVERCAEIVYEKRLSELQKMEM